MDWKWKTALVGALAIGLAATGCVEEEASVVMIGSVVGEGSFEEADDDPEDDPGEDNGEDDDGDASEDGTAVLNCEFSADFDEPSLRSTGFINLDEMDTVGQRQLPGVDELATRNRYDFRTVFENRLEDSRSVGAVSGGEGGGFEGLSLDRNDIMIKSATVSFDHDINIFTLPSGESAGFGFEEERLVNMLVTSGGGVSTLGVPIINNSDDVEQFRDFIEGYYNQLDQEQGQNQDGGESGEEQQLELVARIQLHGETLSGNPVESNRVDFPIDVCVNCEDEETDALCRGGG